MALVIRELVKSYGGVRVLDRVDLSVQDGEIHALLGPNGSGKSTFIRCLSGATVPDSGSIELNGSILQHQTPRTVLAAGVAVIYQHFSVIPSMTVVDNIFLGDERRRALRLDRRTQASGARELLARFQRPIEPETLVGQLSVGDRQLVEIAKALHRNPITLVLDEPTAALGKREASILGEQLKNLRDQGLSILYVTHLLSEVFSIADRVTVLRDGRVVLAARVAQLDPARVIAAISPETSESRSEKSDRQRAGEDPLLTVRELAVDGVGPVDFDIGRGEIVAIFGVLGSGRTELLEAIYGIRRITQGRLELNGHPHQPRDPVRALRAGIVLVAGDRRHQSIFDRLSALDNLLLPHLGRLGRSLARNRRAERRTFAAVAERLRLHPKNPEPLAWTFSGGNQQKLAVGRWLAASEAVKLFMLDEPTQGIDVGARRDLYGLVRQLAHDEGKAVLFTSSDPEETIALADRTLVLSHGRIVASLARGEYSEHRLLALAHEANLAERPSEQPTVLETKEGHV
jgi:ribose transport system ATP-binding protein